MSSHPQGRDSDNPNFIQPSWKIPIEHRSQPSMFQQGWLGKVMKESPTEQMKQASYASNLQRMHDGATFYAFKEAHPNVDFPLFEGEKVMDEDGKPIYHMYQQALNPWVKGDDGKPHPTILMRSTHKLSEMDDEMKDDLFQ